MREPKGESGYSRCLFGERERFRHETAARKNNTKQQTAMHDTLVWAAFGQS